MKITMNITIDMESLQELVTLHKRLLVLPETPNLEPGTGIDALELTVRTHNCLSAEGINTVAHLLTRTPRDLLMLPNMGRKSLNEIKDVLATKGLALKAAP